MQKKIQIFIWILVVLVCIGSIVPWTRADTQTIAVSSSVAPHASDFQLSMGNNTTGTIPQSTAVTYTITYGTDLAYADHITIEASWYQGTVSGNSSPSVNPMDYVTGSAGNAYGGTTPVVDLTNQKITWSITAFPANTQNQTVSFKLRTNSSYTGSNTVTFPTKIRIIATNFTTGFKESDIIYQYNNSLVTPTPQPTSTPTPQPGPTATPGPTSTPIPPTGVPGTPSPNQPSIFTNVNILNLDSSSIDIEYVVTKQGTITLLFGQSPNSLSVNQTDQTNGSGVFHVASLLPTHTYYFQLQLDNQTSEIFSFTTPPVSQIPEVVKTSLVIATDTDVLYSANLQTGGLFDLLTQTPIISIAPNTQYTIAFRITKLQQIQSVEVVFESTNVLAVASPTFASALTNYPYIFAAYNKGNGVYTASIANTLPPGTYKMLLVIKDTQGNITTQQAATVHVLHPFEAIDTATKQPIDDARITLFRYNNNSQAYLAVSTSGIQNPLYTNTNGIAQEQLTVGKYKAEFSRLGYKSVTKYFTVGVSASDDYPIAFMAPTPITLSSIVIYYTSAFLDYLTLTNIYIQSLHESYRFFDLIGLAVIFCFVVLCYLLFSFKTRIRFSHFWWYAQHHSLTLLRKNTPYLAGTVIDTNSGKTIEGARVFLMSNKKQVLKETTTSRLGTFVLPRQADNIMLSVIKQGFSPQEVIYEPQIIVSLQKTEADLSLKHSGTQLIKDVLGLGFEFMLVFSLILEIALFPAFGLPKTAPFLIASLVNVFLWFLYLREKQR